MATATHTEPRMTLEELSRLVLEGRDMETNAFIEFFKLDRRLIGPDVAGKPSVTHTVAAGMIADHRRGKAQLEADLADYGDYVHNHSARREEACSKAYQQAYDGEMERALRDFKPGQKDYAGNQRERLLDQQGADGYANFTFNGRKVTASTDPLLQRMVALQAREVAKRAAADAGGEFDRKSRTLEFHEWLNRGRVTA